MLGENQFLIKYVDPGSLISAFGNFPIGDEESTKLYELLITYDSNFFLYNVALENFDKAFLKVVNQEVYDLQSIINTSFYLNVCLRMINTLDDIQTKIFVYTHLHLNGLKGNLIPKDKYNNLLFHVYYEKYIKNDVIKYPIRATQFNRKTRDIRNSITHDGESLIIRNPINDSSGVYTFISFDGLRERNINLYIDIINAISSDLKEINQNRKDIETLILSDKHFVKNL